MHIKAKGHVEALPVHSSHFADNIISPPRCLILPEMCRSLFFCRPFFGASPPDADDMEGFRKRVTACFGIPQDTTLDYMQPPVVAVMNRQHGSGRSIHNGDELAAVLQQQFGDQGAIVKHIRFNEAMTIREQASVYNQIAVLVQVGRLRLPCT